jgi:hypothetical protein
MQLRHLTGLRPSGAVSHVTLQLLADAASWSKSRATNEKVRHTAIEYRILELGASLSESIKCALKACC